MPVLNTARYVKAALDSILGQSFSDFELVVIDDGSRDGAAAILEACARDEPRMRLTVRENRGLVATRNELLHLARGELVAWMDSDDLSSLDRLQLQVAAFDADDDLACLGGFAQCMDPDGNLLNEEHYPSDHGEIVVHQKRGGGMRFATTMMRRRLALDLGGFREPFSIGEDFDLLLRVGEVGKLANLPRRIYYYRQHLASVCASLGPRWFSYRDHILELARQRREQGRDALQLGGSIAIHEPEPASIVDQRHLAAETYVSWCRSALQNRNQGLAWKYACLAVRSSPMALVVWKTLARTAFARSRGG